MLYNQIYQPPSIITADLIASPQDLAAMLCYAFMTLLTLLFYIIGRNSLGISGDIYFFTQPRKQPKRLPQPERHNHSQYPVCVTYPARTCIKQTFVRFYCDSFIHNNAFRLIV